MKLYIAGPMTGYAELNFPAFHAEARRLRALGFEIVNPAELNPDPTAQWLDCMRVDIAAMMTEKCDGVALLPGWEQSRGATIEHNLARDLGLRIIRSAHIVGLAGDLPVLSGRAVQITHTIDVTALDSGRQLAAAILHEATGAPRIA